MTDHVAGESVKEKGLPDFVKKDERSDLVQRAADHKIREANTYIRMRQAFEDCLPDWVTLGQLKSMAKMSTSVVMDVWNEKGGA